MREKGSSGNIIPESSLEAAIPVAFSNALTHILTIPGTSAWYRHLISAMKLLKNYLHKIAHGKLSEITVIIFSNKERDKSINSNQKINILANQAN